MPAERRVDDFLESGFVEATHGGKLVVETRRVEPGGDLCFNSRTVRPPGLKSIAVGMQKRSGRHHAIDP